MKNIKNVKNTVKSIMRSIEVVDSQIMMIDHKLAQLREYRNKLATELLSITTDILKSEAEATIKAEPEAVSEPVSAPEPAIAVEPAVPVEPVVVVNVEPKVVVVANDRVSSAEQVTTKVIESVDMYHEALIMVRKAYGNMQIDRGGDPGMDIDGVPSAIMFKVKEFINKGEKLPRRNCNNLTVHLIDDCDNVVWGKGIHIPVEYFDEGFYSMLVEKGINTWYRSEHKNIQKCRSIYFMA